MAAKTRVTILKADVTAPKKRQTVLTPEASHHKTVEAKKHQVEPANSAELFGATDLNDKKTFWQRLHDHPAGYALAAFCILLLFFAGWAVFARRNQIGAFNTEQTSRIIILEHDGQKVTLPTDAKTVGELLERRGIKLKKGDRVEPDSNERIVQDNFLVHVYRAEPVTVIDGAAKTIALSAGETARSAVRASGITLYPEDIVRDQWQENIVTSTSFGNTYVITRATPVELSMYDHPSTVRTQAKTVGELVQQKGIKLGKEDYLKPVATTPITPGMKVIVNRNGIRTVTLTEDVPPPQEVVTDTSLTFGATAVRQEGSPGKRNQTYEINIQNGEEVSRRLVQSVTTVEPVKRIVARGSTSNVPASKQAVLAAAGVSPADYAYVDYIFSHESGWNAAAASRNGYYGLGQTSLGKLSSACPNWANDPVCQTRLFTGYATGRYGSWAGAYDYWLSHRWW
ncbi:MAG: hypothetical protein QG629_234 [Patescibacteria group bacterium]|nr:DUF348 domain-containing protein [Candidatus Saccharibacteria bacterium]MDQ5963152.1 hypothetical protein [Patescibacteria group bacterium]